MQLIKERKAQEVTPLLEGLLSLILGHYFVPYSLFWNTITHPSHPSHTTSLARGWQDGRGLTAQLQPDAVPDHASCLWKTTKPGQARSDLSVQHP